VKVKLYVEGGGDSRAIKTRCREGFARLLEKAGFEGRMPRIVACGKREAAFSDFETALKCAAPDEYPLLLVDSEAEVAGADLWAHLKKLDGWDKPGNAEDDQLHLMVQCMETWIVADRDAVEHFFGQDFNKGALPPVNDLEKRPKDDVQAALENATRRCGRDREYRKGKRSFQLLGQLDPETLKKLLPHFSLFCECLNNKL